MSESSPFTFDVLEDAVVRGAAIRAKLVLQPAGGPGSKVFPSTYGAAQDGQDAKRFGESKYALEDRLINGERVPCVLLDSVASQANRVELALLDAWRRHELTFPVVSVDFSAADADLPDPVGVLTTLEMPHRVYDAILRDSVDAQGALFRTTEAGRQVTAASPRDATALYRYCPTALLFGAWDSTGPKGGLGSKFPRVFASEITAIDAELGTKVGSRLDPLRIERVETVAYKTDDDQTWTTTPPSSKAKTVKPSEINHGNVTPSRDRSNGGITCAYALQTTVISMPALRRLRFGARDASAAHLALAALGVAGLALAYRDGYDLRSGALLVGQGELSIEMVAGDGSSRSYALDAAGALRLFEAAAQRAAAAGMAWEREPLTLRPADKLVTLLKASQAKAAKEAPNESDAG